MKIKKSSITKENPVQLSKSKMKITHYDPFESIKIEIQNLNRELKKLHQRTSRNSEKLSILSKDTSTKYKPTKSEIRSQSITLPQKSLSFLNIPSEESRSENEGSLFNTRYKYYQKKAINASRNHKIFTIYGKISQIRKSLNNRGWVEKCAPNYLKNIQILSLMTILKHAKPGNDYETVAISKLIPPVPSYFIWQRKFLNSDNKIYNWPYRNRVYRQRSFDFTTKTGLVNCAESSHWNTIEDLSEIKLPRCHQLGIRDEHNENSKEHEKLFDEFGTVPMEIIKFAIARVKADIHCKEYGDLDVNSENDIINDQLQDFKNEWKDYYSNCNLIINSNMKFKSSDKSFISTWITECNQCLKEAKEYWPNLENDGYNNIWIMKPAYACRGHGIYMKRNFDEIINIAKKFRTRKYIVQKYIEHPLLIYNTKFDIRQYFLITISEDKFSVWIYKNCYLKFSSQEYNLNELEESVHLTNHAVQKHYKNGIRSEKLPDQNMWSLLEFQTYLKDIGKDDLFWTNVIYAGMKKNIIATVLASLDETDLIQNSFEIYGCDFILDRNNFEPTILEINATPDLTSSTRVTAKMCPEALEDVIKVVIDLPQSPNASTGKFELLYDTNIPKVPFPINLYAKGVTKPIFEEQPKEIESRLRGGTNRKRKFVKQRSKSVLEVKNLSAENKEIELNNSLNIQLKESISKIRNLQKKNYSKNHKKKQNNKRLKKIKENAKEQSPQKRSTLLIAEKSIEVMKKEKNNLNEQQNIKSKARYKRKFQDKLKVKKKLKLSSDDKLALTLKTATPNFLENKEILNSFVDLFYKKNLFDVKK